jgi:hypothetical protein
MSINLIFLNRVRENSDIVSVNIAYFTDILSKYLIHKLLLRDYYIT